MKWILVAASLALAVGCYVEVVRTTFETDVPAVVTEVPELPPVTIAG